MKTINRIREAFIQASGGLDLLTLAAARGGCTIDDLCRAVSEDQLYGSIAVLGYGQQWQTVSDTETPCAQAKCAYCGLYGVLGRCEGCGAPNTPDVRIG